MHRLPATVVLLAALLCIVPGSRGEALKPANAVAARSPLKLATWNLEWLIAPATFQRLKRSCVADGAHIAGRQRLLPCDVAARLERGSADFAALARYARRLDADVIALQEVDGAEAAALILPGYAFCFTGRRHLQNTGFAVRKGLPFHCGPDLVDLSLGDSLRRGAQLTLFPGQARELRLLSVHLKSGCGRRPLNDPKEECMVLARQAPALERWIDAQAAAGRQFAVLGDFNRDLLRDPGPAVDRAGNIRSLWVEIDDGNPPDADLTNAAEGARFVNCAANQAFSGYIDFIVFGRRLAAERVIGSFERTTYEARDAVRLKLSDHCPVAVRVR